MALLPGSGYALGIRLGNQDATAVGRGNAFAATADNPSAIYYNPAGLSQLDGTQLSLGAYFLSYEVDYLGFTGTNSGTVPRVWTLPQLFLSHHIEGTPLTFGLGSYSGFGLGSNWPDDGPLRNYATDTELMYSTVTPVLSWEIAPNFSVAAGLTVNRAEASFRRGVAVPGDYFLLEGDDIALGYTLGLLWAITEQHSVGLTYRSAVDLSFSGRAALNVAGAPVFEGPATADLTMPRQIVFGYSFRPTPAWNLEANVEWTQWEVFDSLTANTVGGPITERLNWQNSVVISLGGTRYFDNGAWFSLGYWFAQNSVPAGNFNPRAPDMDYHVFSVGGGMKLTEQLTLALTYQIGYGPDRTVRGSTPVGGATADGIYDYLSHAVAITATYRFK
jgi:long-chain fatty acid transport protein